MWNKRNEGDPRQAATAPLPSSPAATAAAPARAPDPPRSIAILGPSVVVKGDIHSEEDLTIEGEVTGLVEAIGYRLTIGPKGNLQTGGVKAREIVVMGKMKGSVEATEKVYIRKDAQLVGDVQTAGIVIEDGAYFKGGIDIRKGPPIKEV
jgi:cytoskeletal protein CcmA (bactofilin family)